MNDKVLENVKVGDKLFEDATYEIYTVTRITPKGTVVAGWRHGDGVVEYRFNKDGHERSTDTWHRKYVRPLTDADTQKIALLNKRVAVRETFREKNMRLSFEQCDAVLAILEAVK